jgi:hypothetical protein
MPAGIRCLRALISICWVSTARQPLLNQYISSRRPSETSRCGRCGLVTNRMVSRYLSLTRRQFDSCRTGCSSSRGWPALMTIVPGQPDELVSHERGGQSCCSWGNRPPSPALQLLSEDPILGQDVLLSPVLLPVELAGYRDNQHEPGVDDGCHRLFVTVESRWSMLKNHAQKRG